MKAFKRFIKTLHRESVTIVMALIALVCLVGGAVSLVIDAVEAFVHG